MVHCVVAVVVIVVAVDGQTDRRTDLPCYYSGLLCDKCGCAV